MDLAGVQLSSKRDQVVELLREAILSGKLSPGERIVESRLSKQLGTSQAPVREALAQLERRGLVVKVANRGTFVSRLHACELRELFTLRSVLDAFAARLAAERARPPDVDRLRLLIAQMRAAEEGADHAALTAAHLLLHETIYEISGHSMLAEIFAQISARMTLGLSFAEHLFLSDGDETDCHVPLIDAIAEHKPGLAERIARDLALGWIDQVVVHNEPDTAGKGERPVERRGRKAIPGKQHDGRTHHARTAT
jgi:DNA-binding GntR family transcriptional regulator